MKLFERSSRRVRLTREGEYLLPYAQRLLADSRQEQTKTLDLYAIPTMTNYDFFKAVNRLYGPASGDRPAFFMKASPRTWPKSSAGPRTCSSCASRIKNCIRTLIISFSKMMNWPSLLQASLPWLKSSR